MYDMMDETVDARKRLRCWMTIAAGVLVDLTDLSLDDHGRLREQGYAAIDGLSDEAAEEILTSCEGYITAPWG